MYNRVFVFIYIYIYNKFYNKFPRKIIPIGYKEDHEI